MADAPRATETIIIRHAEKPRRDVPPPGVTEDGAEDPESLPVRGWQSAGALALALSGVVGPPRPGEVALPGMILASWVSADTGF